MRYCVLTSNNISEHSLEAREVNAAGVLQVVRHPLDPRVTELRVYALEVAQAVHVEVYIHNWQGKLRLFEG